MKKASTIKNDAEFMATYLAQHSSCSSWDFEADLAFAKHLGLEDEIKVIKEAMDSSAPFSFIIAAWEMGWKKTITNKRLNALRALVKAGRATAYWTGLGEGAYNTFGCSRTRTYTLI